MQYNSWITNVILALAGVYLISVEFGLSEKTPLLYLGIAFLLPLVLQVIFKFSNK